MKKEENKFENRKEEVNYHYVVGKYIEINDFEHIVTHDSNDPIKIYMQSEILNEENKILPPDTINEISTFFQNVHGQDDLEWSKLIESGEKSKLEYQTWKENAVDDCINCCTGVDSFDNKPIFKLFPCKSQQEALNKKEYLINEYQNYVEKKYNEYRKEADKFNKEEKELGGSHPSYWDTDCGESSVREDFSQYANLKNEISFMDMLELEQRYDKNTELEKEILVEKQQNTKLDKEESSMHKTWKSPKIKENNKKVINRSKGLEF